MIEGRPAGTHRRVFFDSGIRTLKRSARSRKFSSGDEARVLFELWYDIRPLRVVVGIYAT